MNNLIYFLIVSGISMIILYSIYYLFLRNEKLFASNRMVLLLSIMISLCIPFFDVYSWFFTSESNSQLTVFLETITISNRTPFLEPETVGNQWANWILIVYFIGASFFFIRLIFHISKFLLLIKRSSRSIIYFNNQKIHLIYTIEDVGSFSTFNYIFIHRKQKNDTNFESIIQHEISHIKYKHTWDLLFLEIINIIHWFNPIIWFYKASIRNIHEFQADKKVISTGINLIHYQQLLLEQSFGFQRHLLVNYFNQSLIKKRIKMMTTLRSRKKALIKIAMVLPLILIIPALISCSMNQKNSQQDTLQDQELILEENINEPPPPPPPPTEKDSIYVVVEQMPQYPGGDQARIKFLAENILYPEQAKKDNIQGTVFVTFVVTKEGEIKDVELLRGIGGGCDEETIRVIKMMPNWKPGYNDKGEAISFQYNLPVKFKLQ